MDLILQVFQALGYLLSLVLLAALCTRAVRWRESRRFWVLLALTWLLGLLGSAAWFIHDLTTAAPLTSFSYVDLFFLARYALIGLALWLYPAPLPGRAGAWVVAAMLIVNFVIWPVYFQPVMAQQPGPWTDFLGYAMYPTLDVGMVVLVWLRYRAVDETSWARVALWLLCSMLSYGLANTVNLSEYAFPPLTGGALPNLLWILSDVFVLMMALGAQKSVFEPGRCVAPDRQENLV
jgi:hypothetical protein